MVVVSRIVSFFSIASHRQCILIALKRRIYTAAGYRKSRQSSQRLRVFKALGNSALFTQIVRAVSQNSNAPKK